MVLVNTCLDAFIVHLTLRCILFASWQGLCYMLSYIFSLGWHWIGLVKHVDRVGQHMLKYILCSRWHWMALVMECVWLTRVEIHIVSSLALEGFGQHKLTCILCASMCLFNTCWVAVCILTCIGWILSRQKFDGMVLVWSSHIEMHFVSSVVWDGFGQHFMSCILCIRWQGNYWSTQVGIFCVLLACSVEIHLWFIEMQFIFTKIMNMHF